MKYLLVYLLTGVPLLSLTVYSAIRDANQPPPELPRPLAGQFERHASAADSAQRRAAADAAILAQLQAVDLLGRETMSDDDGSHTSPAMVQVLRAWRGVQRTLRKIETAGHPPVRRPPLAD